MVFIPTVVLSDFVRWDSIDENSARSRSQAADFPCLRFFIFNEKDEIINFVTEDRYMTIDGGYEKATWSTPFSTTERLGGFMIPTGRGSCLASQIQGSMRKYSQLLLSLYRSPYFTIVVL
jgi:hypothetical protein